jgi:hypothetical protein
VQRSKKSATRKNMYNEIFEKTLIRIKKAAIATTVGKALALTLRCKQKRAASRPPYAC